MKKSRARAGRGVLVILALFLASSGALRIGAGIGQAMANAPETDPAPEVGEVAQCTEPPAAVAAALTARQHEIALQEAALAERMAALTLADQAIDLRMSELQVAEASLKDTLALADGAAEQDLVRLTAVYEAMKPKDAAALFEAMDPQFSAGFLGRMQAESAAAILSGMQPERAYSVSAMIAGRNASVPKE